MATFSIEPIAIVESCFRQKFGVPRQPRLVDAASGYVLMEKPFSNPQAFSGLEEFSHIWLLFQFHQSQGSQWQPMVRPPRLGGNKKKGVFATRSPFRANAIGLSVVRLNRIERKAGRIRLSISGHDLVDGTPVIDIKPYLPYADSIPDARASYAQEANHGQLSVVFEQQAELDLLAHQSQYPQLKMLIEQVIAQDPRPAYKNEYLKTYGLNLYDFNIKWVVNEQEAVVLCVEHAGTSD